MQDIIDLHNSLKSKNLLFYFDNSRIYIISETYQDSLELDLTTNSMKIKLTNSDQIQNTKNPKTDQKTIDKTTFENNFNKVLQIFEDFWLDRNNF